MVGQLHYPRSSELTHFSPKHPPSRIHAPVPVHPGRNPSAFTSLLVPPCYASFCLTRLQRRFNFRRSPTVSRDREPATWLTSTPPQAASLVALKKPCTKESHEPVQVCSRLFCRCSGVSGLPIVARTGAKTAARADGL